MSPRLEAAVDRLMTCARAYACSHEEACFTVAKWAREQLDARRATSPPAEVPPPAEDRHEPAE